MHRAIGAITNEANFKNIQPPIWQRGQENGQQCWETANKRPFLRYGLHEQRANAGGTNLAKLAIRKETRNTLMDAQDLKNMPFKESKANLDFLDAYKSELKGKRKRIYVQLCRSLPERWLAREATFYTDAQRPVCLFVHQHERLD